MIRRRGTHWAIRLVKQIYCWNRREGLVVSRNDFSRCPREGYRKGIGQNFATLRRDGMIEGPWLEHPHG